MKKMRRITIKRVENSGGCICLVVPLPFQLVFIALTQYSMDNSCMDFQTFITTEAYSVLQCLKCHENLY